MSEVNIYHTNLRNIGLFLTLSIGLITFSSQGIVKKKSINTLLKLFGIVFLVISFLLSRELHEHIKKNNIKNSLRNINNILRSMIVIILIIIAYFVVTGKY